MPGPHPEPRPAARWSRGRIPPAAGTRAAAEGGQEARGGPQPARTRSCRGGPALGLRGRRRASPASSGFFEEVESYRYKLHVRVFLSRYRSQSPCPRCQGTRLKPQALAVRVAGATIAEFAELDDRDSTRCWWRLKLTAWEAAVAREILASCAPSSRSCCASGSATSRSPARPARCRAARPSASTWPTSSAPSSSARSTCSTSRRSGCTRATPCGWPSSAASWPRPATRWSSSSTTARFIEAADYVRRDGPRLGRARRRDRLRGHPGRVPARTRAP